MNDIMDDSSLIATIDDLKYLPLMQELIDTEKPFLYSPDAEFELPFYQTRDSLIDVENYKSFLDNSIARFRKSRAYKGYKGYLMSLGLNRCQILGNITEDMASIEMHHNFLTIFDISILISQHIINTFGIISTFDLIHILKYEHKQNRIPIVMLSKTAHQAFHNDPNFYIPMSMTFGKWWELLYNYRYGITLDIAYKVIRYINNCEKNNEITNIDAFNLREEMKGWADYNEYGFDKSMCGVINIGVNNNGNDYYNFKN